MIFMVHIKVYIGGWTIKNMQLISEHQAVLCLFKKNKHILKFYYHDFHIFSFIEIIRHMQILLRSLMKCTTFGAQQI